MKAGLQALVREIIDYAGLFPPARLPLDQAVRNYARYRAGPGAWLLGRFICPTSRLVELTPYLRELASPEAPVRVSALGQAADTERGFLLGLAQDLQAIRQSPAAADGLARVEVIETRLPAEALGAAERVDYVLAQVRDLLAQSGVAVGGVFFEVAPGDNWGKEIPEVAGALRRSNEPAREGPAVGFKLRCGGLTAAAVPPADRVACALKACLDRGVPFKATAGLHHPVRQWDDGTAGYTHGFVNLFGAGALAHAGGLGEGDIVAVLGETEPGSFTFTDGGLAWRGHHATTEQIARVRRHVLLSFGSCSFDEPRDDLRALGWL